MLKTFIYDLNKFDQSQFDEIFAKLPEARRKKITAFQYEDDKVRSLIAGYLLYCYMEKRHIPEADIMYNEFGKPYIKDNPFYFSLSHGEDIVVLVVADKEVGVDVERIRESRPKIVNEFFSEEDKAYLEKHKHRKELFYRLWTIKEATGKCLGSGLADALKKEKRKDLRVRKSKPIHKHQYYLSIVSK